VIRLPENPRVAANILLAVLLVTAQTAALAHAYQHEIGTPQNQACSTCLTAGQLASACVDNPQIVDTGLFKSPLHQQIASASCSINAIVARQRGPPTTL
jgi:hypothetical protein